MWAYPDCEYESKEINADNKITIKTNLFIIPEFEYKIKVFTSMLYTHNWGYTISLK